jgi:hypothetical protein
MSADLAIKEPCLVATTGNITLSNPQTIDGVSVVAGNRVLVKDQATDTQNGIYVAASGAWARATDFDAVAEVVGGTQVLVTSGTLNAGSAWRIAGALTTITPGATSIVFERAVDSDSVAFLQRGPGAELRGAEAKMGDFFNVLDFHDANLGADITDALEAAIYHAAPGLSGIQIFIPEGRFLVTRQIIPDRQITLRGTGMYTTELAFDSVAVVDGTYKGAISLPHNATGDPTKVGSGSASFSIIQDLCISLEGTRPTGLDYGIWTSGRLFATNVRLVDFGFKVRAGAPMLGGSFVAGNANSSLFQNCVSVRAPEYGFLFEGSDANACSIIGCTAIDMADIGFYEASMLGNTYLGCCADPGGGLSGVLATAVSAYRCVNPADNRSLFAGCYAEGGFTGDTWNFDTGGLILQPLGTFPEPLSNVRNITFAAIESSGLWGNLPLTITSRKPDAFTIGDATTSAARFHANGLHIRDRNGNLAQFTAEAGGTMLLKANFPVYANNSAAAGAGLAVDSVYSTATGELRVVV